MSDDETVQPASSQLNIVPATDGRAYIPARDVVLLLRAIASSCRNLADEPDADVRSVACILDYEADTIDRRAIQHTK
ncbi:hypothetical protein [Streptomyces huasconensis]|uniref:hypothetical protein n=1 Tax=Streptomyces huasconensis TaxID=1854574 RepID=UPI0036F65781